MKTYRIVRLYRYLDRRKVIKRGLSLREARAHCHDPETSSSTCKKPVNVRRTKRVGPWFDSFSEES